MAVEFALVGAMFISTMMFVLMVALVLYINQMLDYATVRASRQIVTGGAQAAGLDAAGFRQRLCGYLPAGLQCSNLVINLYVVPKAAEPGGYYTYVKSDKSGLTVPPLAPSGGSFTLGSRGDYQYLQVIYPITFLPTALALQLGGGATFNGKAVYPVMATAAFRVEQYQQ